MNDTMLRSRKKRHECSYGCCGDTVPDRTFRAREKQTWQREVRTEQAD